MEKRIIRSFLNNLVRDEKGMKPFLLKCGLALALTFAGFLYSHIRSKRIKPSTTSPRGHHTRHGSQSNLGGGIRASSSFCSTVSEGNTLEIEETCITRVISSNSLIGHSPRTKQTGDKDEFLLPEYSDHVKEAEFGATTGRNSFKKDVETPRSRVGSPLTHGSSERDDHEQEIRQLRNMIRVLQERERSLEVQLLEYCGLREQEAAVMELQNRLKISSMETKMFNLKVDTLQSENRRLEAQLADHARVLAELETAKTKIKLLKKKIRYEAEQNREQIMNLKHKVAKLQDHEAKGDRDIQEKLERLKELESGAEELRKSNMRLEVENSELARRLDSTQMLAHAVLEDVEAEEQKKKSERLRQDNESLVKEIEQLQADRFSDVEELVYLRWINACLRHELRHYQPPPGKTAARDLSKSLSPTSEKKAKLLILEYANNVDGPGNLSYADSDHWSSSQASFHTDSGDIDDFSPLDNSFDAKANPTSKSKIFGKLMKLIRGKDSQHQLSRATSRDKSSRSLDDVNSPRLSSSMSTGNDTGADGSRSEFTTPSYTSRTSLDLERALSLKVEDRRNSHSLVPGSSKRFSSKNRDSGDSKEEVGSFPGSSGNEKSNLVKYAEALKDSSGNSKRVIIHRRSSAYSSF